MFVDCCVGITQDQIDLARSERENKLLQTMRAVVDSGGSVDNLVDENQKATCVRACSLPIKARQSPNQSKLPTLLLLSLLQCT